MGYQEVYVTGGTKDEILSLRFAMSDALCKNTRCPLKLEFQINNNVLIQVWFGKYLMQTPTKELFTVLVKLKVIWNVLYFLLTHSTMQSQNDQIREHEAWE